MSLLILLLICSSLSGQVNLTEMEDSLVSMSSQLWKKQGDSTRLRINREFTELFYSALMLPGGMEYPFDSLRGISHLQSSDGYLKVITWNLPMNDGSFKYSGFIVKGAEKVIKLISAVESEVIDTDNIVPVEKWYGAIYYSLIERKVGKQTMYTLLGWDGFNNDSDKKLIDILAFDEQGQPVFGSPVFKTRQGIQNRVVIEYAEKANVILRYDRQGLKIQKGRSIREKKEWMIVTDRLVPKNPSLVGMNKHMVPTGETYDAFIFREGFWIFAEDISVVNEPVKMNDM